MWIDFVFVLVLALLFSAVLGWGFGWRHPARSDALGASMLFLFVILLFGMWAAGAWFPVWGPVWYGTPWLTFLLVGLVVSLLILAVVAPPPRPPRTRSEAIKAEDDTLVVGTVFGLFFWLLLLGFLASIAARYLL